MDAVRVAKRQAFRFAVGVAKPTLDLLPPLPQAMPLVRYAMRQIVLEEPEAGTVITPAEGGEWVRGPGVPEGGDAAILYLHGSGYVLCTNDIHRPLISRLSAEAGVPAYSLDYRLAPEHRFPAAFEDTLAAYRRLLDEGFDASKIVVVGDSAGGHLALTLAAALTQHELPVPAGLVLFSPLVDPSWDTVREREHELADPFATVRMGKRLTDLYFGGADMTDARLAVLAGDASQMPPVLLHAGGRELLKADADALAEWLDAAGVECDYTVFDRQMHVFQMNFLRSRTAARALSEAAAFVRNAVQEPAGRP